MRRAQVDLDRVSGARPVDDPAAMALVTSVTADMPPSWARLDQLCREKAQARGLIPRAGR